MISSLKLVTKALSVFLSQTFLLEAQINIDFSLKMLSVIPPYCRNYPTFNWNTRGQQILRSFRTRRLIRQMLPHQIVDRNRPGSRRSELKSCMVLMDEQSNPWERLHPQDTTIQHRGSKLRRRYELSDDITLLSPW